MAGLYHPECAETEVFVGNVGASDSLEKFAGLKTMRLGEIAYYIDGKVIPDGVGCRPLIMDRSDSDGYERIMMAGFRAIRGWQG
jgi:hypothetical protein